ncbi:MAG: hypothetical protein PHC95_09955 [Parabacteroides sp.]|nr:hypothetical protein [Parabacteroides sp.]
MTLIANPIYDSVFKFLMEDERAAKVLLSALLKRDVQDLKMRRNEYTNLQQTRISLFRIDFSAKLVDASGKEQLVLIELQKTWLATETLRFRQYLGTQYLSKDNMLEENNPKGFGLPIISIYILGHKVGDLQQPVVYVRRRYLDSDDHEIDTGVPDAFIESLTHDSIIVQIPYLKENARNHLERILSIFDQDYRIATDEHLLNINDEGMEHDERLLLNRLVLAAASPEIRRDMQVEDEILSEIEARDTAIMMRDKELKQKSQEIEQKSQEIEQKSQEIEQKSQEIEQKSQEIEQKSQEIEQKSQELEQKSQELEQKNKMMGNMIKALLDVGMGEEMIAEKLSISVEDIKNLMR